MKIPFRKLASRVTGFTTPAFGISWTPSYSEAAAAQRIVTFLEDRRVLYSPYELEVPQHVVQSVLEIRHALTDELGILDRSLQLAESVASMRAACRKFLDTVQGISRRHLPGAPHAADERMLACWMPALHGLDEWMFLAALGELRGAFGICIGQIAVRYGVDVEEQLTAILPFAP